MEQFKKLVNTVHGLVVGPGLGRDVKFFRFWVDQIAPQLKNKTIVFDADFLWFFCSAHEYDHVFAFDLQEHL